MTRAEDKAVRVATNRKYYLNHREAIIARVKRYTEAHREHINFMQRDRRRRKKEALMGEPTFIRQSTDAFESELPYGLRANKPRLREEYLRIPIHERPMYDYFLRCKTIEFLRNYERRE